MLIANQFNRRLLAFAAGFLTLAGAGAQAQTASDTNAAAILSKPTYLHDVLPLFLGKCSRCHNEQSTFLPNWENYVTAYNDRKEIKWRVWDAWKANYYKESMPAGNCPEMRSMTEADRALVRNWVDTGATYGAASTQRAQNKAERVQYGKRLFDTMCATCHQLAGQGVANKYPPLAGSDFLNADKDRAILVLIHGRSGEIAVNGKTYNNTMPSFPLSDDDIANALTYVYNSFGNSGKEVTPQEVKALRAVKVAPTTPAKTTKSEFE